jgi:hypothetical protein
MVDNLSLAKSMGVLNSFHGTPVWELYLRGRDAQVAIESKLAKTLSSEDIGRDQVLSRWMQT